VIYVSLAQALCIGGGLLYQVPGRWPKIIAPLLIVAGISYMFFTVLIPAAAFLVLFAAVSGGVFVHEIEKGTR
jgi:hypothetical protein